MTASSDGVLSDIKVLDLSQGVSGPFCAKFLAGLGAEVIKVEPPGTGDSSRHSEPFLGEGDGVESSALFAYLNTSKKSVTLDLDIPDQARSVKQLAQGTDILVESYAPGYLESLGLGYDTLSEANPGLIYVSVTPFGQTGPYRDYKGGDIVAQAIGALMYTIGLPDREPLKVGGESVLYTTGISAFSAAMLALHVRDAEGFGQHVDISAMDVMTVAQIHSSINEQFGHTPVRRPTNLVRAKDGWVSPGLESGVQQGTWPKVCELMGVPELADDSRFTTQEARRTNQQDLLKVVGDWAATTPKEEIYHTLQALRTITGYVATVEDLLVARQLVDRQFFQTLPDPVHGDVVHPGAPFRMADDAWRLLPPPRLGEHNEEILNGRLGFPTRNWPKSLTLAGRSLSATTNKPALQGLRILDLSQVAAGPYATMFLGFMGAEVIKLESRSRMDINRGRAKPGPRDPRVYPDGEQGERPYNRTAHHVHRNINKLSVTLDLAAPKGKELFLGLIRVCDVLVENYRGSVMDRLGLGYDAVSEANPQLIYLKISSQGATGPEANYGSLGSTLEQTAGLASITGYEDGLPLMTNEVYPDPVVGILSFGALMAALRRRRQTGLGCLVDLSQREVTSMLLGESVLDFSVTGRVAGAMGNKHRDMAPHGVYPCLGEDMWVAVSAGTDDEWLGLCLAIGQPELADDPRFKDTGSRRANHGVLDEIISSWTRGSDHYRVMHLLQAEGVPAGAVLKGSETIVDPHLEARGFWDTVNHPEAGIYKQTTTPWILSKSPRQPAVPAAGLGEHNYQVLGGLLGLPTSEIDALVEQGITGDVPDPSA